MKFASLMLIKPTHLSRNFICQETEYELKSVYMS